MTNGGRIGRTRSGWKLGVSLACGAMCVMVGGSGASAAPWTRVPPEAAVSLTASAWSSGEDVAPPRPPKAPSTRSRATDVPEVPGPPAEPDLTPELKAAATAYVDALRTLCYDSTMVAAMSLRLPADNAPVTPENKAAVQQVRRERQKLRESLRDLRDGPAREVRAISPERLVHASRAQAADLRLLVDADLRALDQVQDLLAQTGQDKYVAYAKAVHLLKDLETGERGARRKATLKAIMALKLV